MGYAAQLSDGLPSGQPWGRLEVAEQDVKHVSILPSDKLT